MKIKHLILFSITMCFLATFNMSCSQSEYLSDVGEVGGGGGVAGYRSAGAVSVFFNSNDKIDIKFNLAEGNIFVNITDVSGIVVYAKHFDTSIVKENSIDISGLPANAYVITLNDDNYNTLISTDFIKD